MGHSFHYLWTLWMLVIKTDWRKLSIREQSSRWKLADKECWETDIRIGVPSIGAWGGPAPPPQFFKNLQAGPLSFLKICRRAPQFKKKLFSPYAHGYTYSIYALSLVLYDEYMHKYFDDFNLHSYKTIYKPGENLRGLKKVLWKLERLKLTLV